MIQLDLPRDAIADLCRRRGIKRLAVLGSAIRDDLTPDSDVDLFVAFLPGVSVGLEIFAIERELGDLIGRKVDLNTEGFLSDDFHDEVIREAESIYESSTSRAADDLPQAPEIEPSA